jgi:8-oxo-dGTP diphosphatase
MIEDINEDPHKGKILPIVVITVFNEKNQCLLLKRNKHPYMGYWEVVGGKIEFGESFADAAKREIFEETGVHIVPVFLGVQEHIDGNYHRILISYYARTDGKISITEHKEFGWFDVTDLPEKLIPYTEELILAAAKRIGD